MDASATVTFSVLLCLKLCWADGSQIDCSFEQGNLCGYQQLPSTGTLHDELDWTLNRGPTPTSLTGPDNDHTYGNSNGHYIYINAAASGSGTKRATLVSPVVQCHTPHATLTFWYSMYGSTMGQLHVQTATPHLQQPHDVWYKSGNQGPGWKMATVTLDLSHPTEIVFYGYTIWGSHSDMAVDDISLAGGSCSASVTYSTNPPASAFPSRSSTPTPVALSWACNFERGDLCGYQQLSSTGTPRDDLDWILNQGPTHTSSTGPDNDHTYANNQGHYIYMPSSSPGQKAALVSPTFHSHSAQSCLTFWYSMYGDSMGQLMVLTATPHLQHLHVLWSKSGNQEPGWIMANITLDTGAPFEIIFDGISGSGIHSVMALDDITLTNGSCHTLTTLTTTTSTTTSLTSSMDTTAYNSNETATIIETTTSTGTPSICQQCEGLQCFTSPMAVNCSSQQAFCSSRVTDFANGERKVAKGCTSATDCNAWIPGDAEVQFCLSVDQQVTGHDLDCLFCCYGDMCNKGPNYIPERETWIGQNLPRLLIG